MSPFLRRALSLWIILCLCGLSAGCSDNDPAAGEEPSHAATAAGGERKGKIEPISLTTLSRIPDGSVTGGSADELTGRRKVEVVLEALDPFQILIGTWQGKTHRDIGGAISLETPIWKRDFQADPDRPAITFASETSPYFKSGRLSYLLESGEYEFTARDRYGEEKVYRGSFSEPVRELPGDDGKLHRTFKLQLTRVEPAEGRKVKQIIFNQQDNNRYLLEIYDEVSGRMHRYDTVANQREGTSFALNPDDYRGRECIISGGLGTMTVTYKGQSYPVCCTGCRDAFIEDPETWLARYKERKNRE